MKLVPSNIAKIINCKTLSEVIWNSFDEAFWRDLVSSVLTGGTVCVPLGKHLDKIDYFNGGEASLQIKSGEAGSEKIFWISGFKGKRSFTFLEVIAFVNQTEVKMSY